MNKTKLKRLKFCGCLITLLVFVVLSQGCSPSVISPSSDGIPIAPSKDLSIYKQQVMRSTDQSVDGAIQHVNNTTLPDT